MFKKRNGIPYTTARRKTVVPKQKPDTARWIRLNVKVHQRLFRFGKVFIAQIKYGGRPTKRRVFSVNKLGEQGAKLAASLQRMVWLIECGAWKPDNGDPLMFSNFTEMLKGNSDYEHSEVVDVLAPWHREREE